MKALTVFFATFIYTQCLFAQSDIDFNPLIIDYTRRLVNLAEEREFHIHFLKASDLYNAGDITESYQLIAGKPYTIAVISVKGVSTIMVHKTVAGVSSKIKETNDYILTFEYTPTQNERATFRFTTLLKDLDSPGEFIVGANIPIVAAMFSSK